MEYGGPLFFTHYSFLGLNPNGLTDKYTNYFEQNRAHALIQSAYAIDNPKKQLATEQIVGDLLLPTIR